MNLSNLSENDLFGRYYLKVPGNTQYDNYFRSIDALRPLLRSKDWNKIVTGYYLNIGGNWDAVRLSYFTKNPAKVRSNVESYCSQNNIIESQIRELPWQKRCSTWVDAEILHKQ